MERKVGLYSLTYENRPKQLETIQAAKEWTESHDGVMPTVSELAASLGENQGCIHERVKKLRQKKIVITRLIQKDERMKLSLKSRGY